MLPNVPRRNQELKGILGIFFGVCLLLFSFILLANNLTGLIFALAFVFFSLFFIDSSLFWLQSALTMSTESTAFTRDTIWSRLSRVLLATNMLVRPILLGLFALCFFLIVVYPNLHGSLNWLNILFGVILILLYFVLRVFLKPLRELVFNPFGRTILLSVKDDGVTFILRQYAMGSGWKELPFEVKFKDLTDVRDVSFQEAEAIAVDARANPDIFVGDVTDFWKFLAGKIPRPKRFIWVGGLGRVLVLSGKDILYIVSARSGGAAPIDAVNAFKKWKR